MIKCRSLVYIVCCGIALLGCNDKFPVDKRFWTPEDYKNVIFEIQYRTPKGEPFPKFSNPETSVVIEKLVDAQNYLVVVKDTELGINYKNEVTQEFFDRYRDLRDAYSAMDVQDKYVYAEELVAIEKFGLGLQIQYFKLGNDRIIEQSEAPEASRTKEILMSNGQTIVKNFFLYLDNIKEEKRFSSYAPLLADGITTHFITLIETFPKANYEGMLIKAKTLSEKTQVPELKSALDNLVDKLKSLKQPV